MADKVVLDLKYEARDVPQRLLSQTAIDAGSSKRPCTEALRIAFYKAVALLARACADIAQNLTEAGYSDAEAAAIQREIEFYAEIHATIKKSVGEELDTKPFEADMRHLLTTYIQADAAAGLGDLGALSLTGLIIQTGIHDAIARKLNKKGKLSQKSITEGIINNVRKTIIRDQLTDPKVCEQMSRLLDDLIEQAQAAAFAHRCNLAFGRVDIQFEGVLPVSRVTLHNPLRGTITLDRMIMSSAQRTKR